MIIRNINGERFALLVTFKAIFESGGISAAAKIQGMTQSAVSKHLQKLREWFNDELFVRTASGMEPTEKSKTLIERVEHILQEVATLSDQAHFDPSLLTGGFTIATTSEVSQRLIPGLLKKLSNVAPKLRITVINLTHDYSIRELESGKVNLVMSVNWHAPEQLMQKRLYSDQFVCLMHKDHALAKGKLTLKAYANATHIMVAPLGKERGFIDEQLAKNDLQRQIRLSVPDFSQIDTAVLQSDHIVTLPKHVASKLKKDKNLIIKALPFDVPDIDYYLFWHKRFSNENTNQWMRELIFSLLKP